MATRPDAQAVTPRQRLKWAERYNCHRFLLAPGLELAINWTSVRGKNWEVRVFGQTIEKDFVSFDEAEAAAIDKARTVLTSALGRLQ